MFNMMKIWMMVSLVISAAAVGRASPRKYEVIKNDLEKKQIMVVECKDKHGSFGVMSIPYGKSYNFNFKPNVFTADYFCSFDFDGHVHWFDIYQNSEEYSSCTDHTCHWFVKEGGPCFSDQAADPPFYCYQWNKDTQAVLA